MTSRAARVIVFLLLVLAVAGAAWYHQVLEQERSAAARELAHLSALRETVGAAMTRARSAQQAYLAPGQGLGYWSTEFAEAMAEIAGALEGFAVTESDAAPTAALESADRAYRVYEGLDRKVRGFVQSGNLMMAADVIYEDGVKTSRVIVESVGEAHDALAAPLSSTAERTASMQQMLAAAAVGLGVLVALLLVPRGGGGRTKADGPSVASGTDVDEDLPLSRRDPVLPVAPTPRPLPAESPAPVTAAATAGPVDPDARAALASTAVVCTDLGRVKDGEQLRAVLARAAGVLDASGVIVWVADAAGRQLRPVFAYGYPEEALRRIPALPRSADNATAMAWREARPQVVDATESAPGAIAVPLLAPQGCTGVLAAEIEHGREASPHTRAVAEILAAQLAVLIPAESAPATQ